MEKTESSYRSRKFIITVSSLVIGVGMAYLGKLTPELANIILAANASYNLANAWAGRG